MRWLVISDIHIAIHDFPTVNAQSKLLKKIKSEGPFDFILITGDSMDRSKDLNLAVEYIKSIMDVCKIEPDHIYICPGNHDIVRPDSEKKSDRFDEINRLRHGHRDIVSHLNLDGQSAFPWMNEYNMFDNLYYSIKNEKYKPFSVFEPEGENFRIVSVDSCLFSVDDNDPNHLFVCTPQLAKLSTEIDKDDKKLNIAMMHHGVAFLDQDDARMFENWLADYKIDVLYCGHNHRTGMSILADAIYTERGEQEYRVREFTCGACHVDEAQKTEATFFICEYIQNEECIKTKAFHFANQISDWCLDTNSTRNFIEGVNIYPMPWRKDSLERSLGDRLKQICQLDPLSVVDNIYDDPNDAEKRIKELVNDTKFLYYFGIKGDSIYDDYHGTERFIANHHDIEAKFLLANPCSHYLKDRLMSLSEYNKNMLKLDKHWSDLYKKGINLYEECEKEDNWSVRYHNEPIIFRMYIFNQCLLISFYLPEEHSKNSPLYEYRNGSRMYEAFKILFEEKWMLAQKTKPILDREHSFLKWEYDIVPSLVLNITDKCDFKCYYCPEGGENLHHPFDDKELVEINEIFSLMESYIKNASLVEPKHDYVLRITGGEPLLTKETRDKVNLILKKSIELGFQKVVLCTNGNYLGDAYNSDKDTWEKVKDVLLLKISIDTLQAEVFRQISKIEKGSNYILKKIIENIEYFKQKDYKIELNTVLTHFNISELKDIYEYACNLNLVGVKVFTINDFGGKKTILPEDKLSMKLKELIQDMLNSKKIYEYEQIFLNGDTGIRMELFSNKSSKEKGCILKIVDHQRGKDCITPDRTYGHKCKDCTFYRDKKCATGLMSLTMRADGLVSYCRLKEQDGFSIKNQSSEVIQTNVNEIMNAFRNCGRES